VPGAGDRRTSGGLRAVAAAAAVLAVIAASWGGYRLFASPSCSSTNTVRLTVAATREIVPAVQGAAKQWVDTTPKVNGKCVAVDVAAAESADVAAAVAAQHNGALSGVGQANGKTRVPDVWIPDSGMWLQRLRAAGGQDWVPADAPSVGRSPVVLAMPQPLASTLGWPDKKLTWADVLPKLTSDAKLRTGIVDPSRDSAGASGLLALSAAANAAGGASAQATTVAALRALATGRATLRDELIARFPRGTDAASLTSSLGAAPLSEQTVIAYNNDKPAVPLAALFIEPSAPALDYPFAVLPAVSGDRASAARALLVTLAGNPYRDRLAKIGLRAADGSAGNGFAAPQGAALAPTPAAKPVDAPILEKVLSTWSAVTLPGRLLAVIDVSGSMAEPVPTAGNASREQVTVEAARRALTGLFDDSWAIGCWTFSTQLEGANDFKELVPVGLLASQRQDLLNALGGIQPKIGGATGLYDTVLAAYKNVQNGWDPSRVNSIVLFTDGKNEDPQGLNLDQLLAELKKAADPNRPIQIIAIGIGPEVSENELKAITGVTGGGTFLAPDPSKIGEIFLRGISLRTPAQR
jgi:Ca-activated chloride channel family protein